MINNVIKIEIPPDIFESWQDLADILAELTGIPAALIMRFTEPYIEVFVSSKSMGNPYNKAVKKNYWTQVYTVKE